MWEIRGYLEEASLIHATRAQVFWNKHKTNEPHVWYIYLDLNDLNHAKQALFMLLGPRCFETSTKQMNPMFDIYI